MTQPTRRKHWTDLARGLAFLGPNILGFLTFTLLPLLFALVLAFTNWDLRLHNQFKDEPLRFVGLENFIRLLSEPDFWRFFGNTLFFMMGIPFGIAGSLAAAMLLSQDLRGGGRRNAGWIIGGAGLIAGTGMLVMLGAGASAMTLLIGGLAAMILVTGAIGGLTVYRTLFYLPHFTAGVATFVLWKNLYNPYTGPINGALEPVLVAMTTGVNAAPLGVQALGWLMFALMIGLLAVGVRRILIWWFDGELGGVSLAIAGALLLLPCLLGGLPVTGWLPYSVMQIVAAVAAVVALACLMALPLIRKREFRASTLGQGVGGAVLIAAVLMIGQFILLGFSIVLADLPAAAADPSGLEPPQWLTNIYWAKPALMAMGFWAAIGSNNMLLYLAGLAGVPKDLYEAAEIDGAGRVATFWNVTWPQLAPVTFFIVVMAVIHGLQGGFEMARTMTQGGPAGATTTLSYFVYIEGFETGRLGYASAITWTLFGLVFVVTLFNWKFGNRYVND
ncbi:MAG: sugar ABC transporter permease [Planctomycetota bacterium]